MGTSQPRPADGDRHDVAVLASLLSDGRRLAQVLDRLPAAAYTCDAEGLITYFNEPAERIWGRRPVLRDPVDRWCGSFRLYGVDGSPIAHARCWMARAVLEGLEFAGREIVVERTDGGRSTVLAHANPIHDADGVLRGGINVLVDITSHKEAEHRLRDLKRVAEDALRAKDEANAQLEGALQALGRKQHELLELNRLLVRQASTDPLTGLSNRRALHASLGHLVPSSLRDGDELGLLMIDLDRFKLVNDRYGHQSGDRALVALADLLRTQTRQSDVVARFGGEEFALVLPGMPAPVASAVAESIRAAVAEGGLGFGLTVSIGVASLEAGDDADTIVARADAALYAAKLGGRDRVHAAPRAPHGGSDAGPPMTDAPGSGPAAE